MPAGSFSALKVIAQVDIATVMPNWPRFVMHVVQPVVPKNTLYFQATPPYRLLKQQGTTFVGGPEVTTELIRFYIAGAPLVAVPAVPAQDAPVAAALGGSSILVKHSGHGDLLMVGLIGMISVASRQTAFIPVVTRASCPSRTSSLAIWPSRIRIIR